MAVTKSIFLFFFSLITLFSCSKHKKMMNQNTDIAYFYFDANDTITCQVRKEGLEYLKEPYQDSIRVPFFNKSKREDGKISYRYCRYGGFIHNSISQRNIISLQIDTINLIKPTNRYSILDNLKKHNFIVEPINDTSWSVKEVQIVKENPNIKM